MQHRFQTVAFQRMDLLAGKLGRIFRASHVDARGHQIGQLPGLGLDLAAAPPPGCGSTINFPATTAKIGATTTSTTMNPAAVIPTMPVRVIASAMTPAVGIPVVEIRVVEIRAAATFSRKADGDVLQKSDARGSIPQTARDGICFFDDQNLGKSGGLPEFRDRTASIRGRARGNEQESHPAVGPRWRRGTHPFGSAPSHR